MIISKAVLTLLALCAFAGNSVLCRWALAEYEMAPASFTLIRLLSGAAVLFFLIRGQSARMRASMPLRAGLSWWGALWLAVYAYAFAFAYIELATGVGALVLFTCVQLSMLLIGAWRGMRYSAIELLGIIMALAGFGYLIAPQLATPFSGTAVLLMMIAGVAWGAYSTVGRGASTPLTDTFIHFARAALLSLPLLPLIFLSEPLSWPPLALAVASGALTSAVGYAIWFKVLPHLRVSSAAVAQLAVPVLAACGGIIFVAEPITQRFVIACGVILSGILLVILRREKKIDATKTKHIN
ncbi:EamA family transporter [Pseudidiomarina insulisalsae]|uniref:EamA family transporter n=2 Tax=Pseudidiomarina insulisalsae TaxID=575789 RepID=A0A432YN42_9GAMM|nr:EamA family transporter [Pseudidiomarina insulisalsae]